jgi:cytoskeletal protein RodZ
VRPLKFILTVGFLFFGFFYYLIAVLKVGSIDFDYEEDVSQATPAQPSGNYKRPAWILEKPQSASPKNTMAAATPAVNYTPSPKPSPKPSPSAMEVPRAIPSQTLNQKSVGDISQARVLSAIEAERLAEGGDARAQAILSIYYALGYKTQKDMELAAKYALASAKRHNPLGIYRVAAMMENGEGFEKNTDEARRLKELASEGLLSMTDDPYALTAMGVMLFRGEGGFDRDRELAVNLYKTAADMGYAPAQYNYSAALALGQGTEKNEEQSQKYWKAAYDQRYPPALAGRVKAPKTEANASSPATQPRPSQRLPQGIPVNGRPGFFSSPYAPNAGMIDARGIPAGSIAKCPFTKKSFIIPAIRNQRQQSDYPRVEDVIDESGNSRRMIIPNPW